MSNLVRVTSAAVVLVYNRRRRLLPLLLATVITGFFLVTVSDISQLRHRFNQKLWEQPTLLKINFSWISNNESICKLSSTNWKDVHLMPILVHSARSHFRERLAIRRSYGSIPVYRHWNIRLVFLLGQADRSNLTEEEEKDITIEEKRLQDEQHEYGDLVIGSFIDSYHNLTYKHLMGYKWILNFCRGASLVLKTDDDMFVHILGWLDIRMDDLDKWREAPDLYCITFDNGSKPIRDPESSLGKWYITLEDWPQSFYPEYCSGWAYMITVGLMEKIYSVSNEKRVLWIDDLFVTGVLMEVAKERYNFQPNTKEISWSTVENHINRYRPMCENGTFDGKINDDCVTFIERDEFFERDMMCLWNKTLHDRKHQH